MRIGVEDQRINEPADQSFRRHRTEKMGKNWSCFGEEQNTRKDPIFGWFEDK
jgi:hypothetical protein